MNEERPEKKIWFAWSQIACDPSSDHGCFVFINSAFERIDSILRNKGPRYILFDQKMGGKTLIGVRRYFILSNFSNFVMVVCFYKYSPLTRISIIKDLF